MNIQIGDRDATILGNGQISGTGSACGLGRKWIIKKRAKAVVSAFLDEQITATKDPGEKLISGDGYYMIKTPKDYKGKTYIDGRYIYEHKYLMEKRLKRLLKYNENVDHKNEKKLDNRGTNLVLKTRAEHTRDTKPADKARNREREKKRKQI